MNKEVKDKVLVTFVITTFLVLFAFQGKAENSAKTKPASVENITVKSAPATQESIEDSNEDNEDDDSSAVYYPSSEDFSEDDNSVDE